MKPELVKSATYHRRLGGPTNAFRYSVDYVLCEPEAAPDLPWLMSRNGRNLASINDVDHGGKRGAGSGAAWVREVLRAQGLAALENARILLLAQPRIVGYLFNPVCFWLVLDENEALLAFVAEVNNTMGDRHSYLCKHDDLRPIKGSDTITAKKIFHVSPFQTIGGEYKFNFDFGRDDISVRIDFRNGDHGLVATLAGPRSPLSSARILGSIIRRPFGSLRVVALIHWQAAKLLWKRAPFTRRPKPPLSEVS